MVEQLYFPPETNVEHTLLMLHKCSIIEFMTNCLEKLLNGGKQKDNINTSQGDSSVGKNNSAIETNDLSSTL